MAIQVICRNKIIHLWHEGLIIGIECYLVICRGPFYLPNTNFQEYLQFMVFLYIEKSWFFLKMACSIKRFQFFQQCHMSPSFLIIVNTFWPPPSRSRLGKYMEYIWILANTAWILLKLLVDDHILVVTKNPQNVHRKFFWPILMTFIYDVKIDVNILWASLCQFISFCAPPP